MRRWISGGSFYSSPAFLLFLVNRFEIMNELHTLGAHTAKHRFDNDKTEKGVDIHKKKYLIKLNEFVKIIFLFSFNLFI